MTDVRKRVLKGRRPPSGSKRQFLIHMDPEVIKGVKLAGIEREVTASSLVERAVKEWLERNPKS